MPTLNEVELLFLLGEDTEQGATWQHVDIDRSTSFSFNFQESDIVDPTVTKIPFSFAITLPKTNINDNIFSNIGIYNANLVNFNAIERTEFRLYINGNIYQQGYWKLESTTLSNYSIRLYGGLGDFFYGLSDTSDNDGTPMYLKNLAFENDFNHVIDRNYVAANWNMSSLPADSANAANGNNSFFGYAMTYQGQYDNFDSDTIVNSSTETVEATWSSPIDNKSYSSPQLNEHRKNTITRNAAGNVTDAWCGHYVSYYQRPMIRLNKIFNKILDRMRDKGWETVKDDTFFNESNVYWNDTWCLLPQYSTDGTASGTELTLEGIYNSGGITGNFNRLGPGDATGTGKTTSTVAWTDDRCRTLFNLGNSYENTNSQGGQNLSAGANVSRTYTLTINNIDLLPENQNNIQIYLPLFLRCISQNSNDRRQWKSPGDLSTSNSLNISCNLRLGSNNIALKTLGSSNTVYRASDNNTVRQNKMGSRNWYYQERSETSANQEDTNQPSTYGFEDVVNIMPGTFSGGDKISLVFTVSGDTRWFGNGSTGSTHNYDVILRLLKDGFINYSESGGIGVRSGANITYDKIMQSDETCLQFLMSYCKTFGMYFVKDPYEKKVTIMTRNTYYGAQERLDWTYKIDYSKEWREDMANFDYRIGLLKWRDSGTKYEEEYYAKNSKEYGSLRVDNRNGFSDEEKDYFSDNIFSNCIIATGYDQYYLGRTNTLYQDNKAIPYLQDNSGDGINANFILVFREFPYSVATNYPFYIADDNGYMLTYGYSWSGNAASLNAVTKSSNYPTLRRVIERSDELYSLYFGAPNTIYNDDEAGRADESTRGEGTIYNRFWANYLRDRFDKDTKTLTCYVDLSINDIQQDLFRKFIFINDTCWVLNKISGFNPLTPGPTKVELVKVKDINNYLSQKYIAGRFWIQYPLGEDIIYDSDEVVTNPVIMVDSSAQSLSLTFNLSDSLTSAGWSITDVEGLTISPQQSNASSVGVNITLPENTTGSVITWNVPIRWGANSTTVIQIVQVSNWTVNTSVSPAGTGTSNATGGGQTGEIITVADGTSVTLTVATEEGYSLNYWEINGSIVASISPVITVNEDINAVAYLYDATAFVTVTTTDPYTQVYDPDGNRMTKYGSYYWILESGQIYTFENTQPNLSGYAFSDGVLLDPNNTFTKSFTNNDTLNVYYDSLLVNVIIVNNSRADFDSANVTITTPSGIPVAVFGGSVGAGMTVQRGIIYPSTEYGLYILGSTDDDIHEVEFSQNTITYSKGMAIPTITITLTSAFTPELDIQPRQMTVGPNITVYTIDLTCNTTWQCKVDEIYDGIVNVAPLFGTGDATVTVTTGVNPTNNQRTGIATFETTYGQDDVFINHTVTQRPLNGTLNINIENLTSNTIRPTSNITGNISRGNTVIDQFTIFDVPSTGSIYDFTLQEGDYVISLSSYSGISNNGTYTISPATSQSISLLGGSNEDVTYTFSEESSAVLLTINFSNDVSTIGLFLNTPDPNNTNYYQLELVYDNTITYRYNRNTGLTINNGSTSTGSTNIFPGGTILVYSYTAGIYTRLGSFVLSGNDQTIILP